MSCATLLKEAVFRDKFTITYDIFLVNSAFFATFAVYVHTVPGTMCFLRLLGLAGSVASAVAQKSVYTLSYSTYLFYLSTRKIHQDICCIF